MQWRALMDRWKLTYFGAAVLNLHRTYEARDGQWWCAGCDAKWPCPTIKHCMVSVDMTMEDLANDQPQST